MHKSVIHKVNTGYLGVNFCFQLLFNVSHWVSAVFSISDHTKAQNQECIQRTMSVITVSVNKCAILSVSSNSSPYSALHPCKYGSVQQWLSNFSYLRNSKKTQIRSGALLLFLIEYKNHNQNSHRFCHCVTY